MVARVQYEDSSAFGAGPEQIRVAALNASCRVSMLGFPVIEAADMPDVAANSLLIAFGNFEPATSLPTTATRACCTTRSLTSPTSASTPSGELAGRWSTARDQVFEVWHRVRIAGGSAALAPREVMIPILRRRNNRQVVSACNPEKPRRSAAPRPHRERGRQQTPLGLPGGVCFFNRREKRQRPKATLAWRMLQMLEKQLPAAP
jgi:hypothetical protein